MIKAILNCCYRVTSSFKDKFLQNPPQVELCVFIWNCQHLNRDVSDEELIKNWEFGPSRSQFDEEDEELYEVEKLTPDEFAEGYNDECYVSVCDYIRFIEIPKNKT